MIAALIALGLFVVRPQVDPLAKYVHHGEPTFNLLYRRSALHKAAPQGSDSCGCKGAAAATTTIAVEPLTLPPATGDIAHGALPAFASRHIEQLRAGDDTFQLVAEGRARVNGAPGYEVRFRTGPPGKQTFGNDLMILPKEDDATGALLVTSRRTITGKPTLGKREAALNKASAKATGHSSTARPPRGSASPAAASGGPLAAAVGPAPSALGTDRTRGSPSLSPPSVRGVQTAV